MKLWPKSIKGKQLMLSLSLAVFPLILAAFFVNSIATDIIRTNVETKLRQITLDKTDSIRQWMRERRADVTLLEASDEISAIYDGRVSGNDRSEFIAFYDYFAEQYGTYSMVVLQDAIGNTILQHPERPRLKELPSAEIPPGGQHISFVFKLFDSAHFLISLPVMRNGENRGTLNVAVDLEMLNRITDNIRVGETGEAYIVDSRGYFITHQERSMVLQDQYYDVDLLNRLISGQEKNFVGQGVDYRDVLVLGAYFYMPEFGWGIVAEQDVAEALQPLHRFTRLSIMITGVTIIIAAGLASLLATRNLRPLKQLTETIQEIEAGNFSTRFKATKDDEISQTGRLFNTMLDELEDIRSRLVKKVKAADEDLQRAHEELLHRHEELKLAQERLLHSERLSTMGEIAAGLAHEINNPLSTISMLIYSLQSDAGTDELEKQKIINVIAEEIDKIASMIERFQDLTQPVRIEREPVVIERVIDRAITLVRPRLEKDGIKCHIAVAHDLPVFEGDERHLGQMLLNLLLNSIKAMPRGGTITITVDHKKGKNGRSWIVLELSDTGEGIQPGDMENVFKPFFTTKAEGTGLGLLNVRNIVEQHGGTISLESTPGEGTTFTIRFPRGERRDE